jgi:dynein heavy chain
LWTLAERFHKAYQSWTRGAIFGLDADLVKVEHREMLTGITALMETLEVTGASAPPLRVAETIHGQLLKFAANLPLVGALSNKSLRPRHFRQMADALGVPINPREDHSTSLNKLLELGVNDRQMRALATIADGASSEGAIESGIGGMKAEWAHKRYPLITHHSMVSQSPQNLSLTDRQTVLTVGLVDDVYVLALPAVDQLSTLLDEHLIKTQSMRSSPFLDSFERDLQEWEATLQFMQELLEEWVDVQRTWLYLDPIFGANDIAKSLP